VFLILLSENASFLVEDFPALMYAVKRMISIFWGHELYGNYFGMNLCGILKQYMRN